MKKLYNKRKLNKYRVLAILSGLPFAGITYLIGLLLKTIILSIEEVLNFQINGENIFYADSIMLLVIGSVLGLGFSGFILLTSD